MGFLIGKSKINWSPFDDNSEENEEETLYATEKYNIYMRKYFFFNNIKILTCYISIKSLFHKFWFLFLQLIVIINIFIFNYLIFYFLLMSSLFLVIMVFPSSFLFIKLLFLFFSFPKLYF